MRNNALRPWLIVSYFANVDGMACSHHIDDRLVPLANRGITVTILTSVYVAKIRGVRHLRAFSLSPSGMRFEIRQFLKRKRFSKKIFKLFESILLFPVYPFYFIEKLLVNIDTTWFWFLPSLFRGYLYCLFNPQKLIYSTGGPVIAHIVAGVLARLTGSRWIAEFQDPLIHSYCARSNLELKLLKWAEKFICANAEKVVFLTAEAKRTTFCRTGQCDRGDVIYPGANPLPTHINQYAGSNCLRFVHFGGLGGSRNLECFLVALDNIFMERPELVENVRISLYGSIGINVRQQIETFPYPNTFEIHGLVPRHESISKMRESDVLLLIQNMDEISSETIPSKVYEYLHAQRPILGLIYKNVELNDMLSVLGHIPVDICDTNSIKTGILSFVDLWSSNGISRPTEPSPYTIDSAVNNLVKLAGY